MIPPALALVLAGATLAGCASYQPSQAECFSFTAVAGESSCAFEPLMDQGGPGVGDE